MLRTISITVSGKVQGVFFRQGTKEKASTLGIAGIVSNQPDDTVLIIATGPDEQLEELVRWCHQGPPRAIVNGVATAEVPLRHFSSFTIDR